MKPKRKPELKPLFEERMKSLLGEEFNNYLKSLEETTPKSIRCNTLKISPENLKKRLEAKGWKLKQISKLNPEVMVIEKESNLEPGELGRSLEHQLGYYYIQEVASMLPIIALAPKPEENFLDLCASPGSKTTQAAAQMENTGLIVANEIKFGRIKILASNIGRCGITNTIITKKDGIALCNRLEKQGIQFDKILVDAPCSGEGTLRSKPKTYAMWNIKTVTGLSKLQKSLVASAIKLLKKGGEMIYSTCTHAPEENEEVVDFILTNFPEMEIQKIELPIKTRQGISKWKDKEYSKEVKCACRVYPQDNNTDGFFISKFRKVKE